MLVIRLSLSTEPFQEPALYIFIARTSLYLSFHFSFGKITISIEFYPKHIKESVTNVALLLND